jgi:hypothetical protein
MKNKINSQTFDGIGFGVAIVSNRTKFVEYRYTFFLAFVFWQIEINFIKEKKQ